MSSENTPVALANFTMDDLKDRIAKSVQATFGMMMPDDAFQALTEKAVNDFFHKKQEFAVKEIDDPKDTSTWNRRKILVHDVELTAFELQVYKNLTPIIETEIKEWLTANEKAVKDTVKEALDGPEVSTAFNKSIHTLASLASTVETLRLIESASIQTTMKIRDNLNASGIRTTF